MLQHPIIKGILGVAIFIIVAELLAAMIPDAWASMSFPVGDRFVVELGDIPQWVIAIVAGGTLYKSWKAEKHAALAVKAVTAVAADITAIHHETNSMRAALEAAQFAKGELSGGQRESERAAAATASDKEIVRSDAVADAQTEAQVRAANEPKIP